MATVSQRVATVADGAAFIELTYDDQTEVVTRIAWANNSTRPVRAWFTPPTGARVFDATLQPGQSGSRTLTGNARFNRSASWDFNLAT